MNSTSDQPTDVRAGETLDISRLQSYLRTRFASYTEWEHLAQDSHELVLHQFPAGYSNLTYCLRWGSQEWVLRRPPFGNQVRSAHDMGREFRVLQQLHRVYQLAPRPWIYCEDHSIIGSEFYLMERRQGIILRGAQPPEHITIEADAARNLSESFIDNLAELHAVDYRAAGLDNLGKPQGYVLRQVGGWQERYRQALTTRLASMERLGTWLEEHRPTEQGSALLHNDYKYDNLMLDNQENWRIVAVLDWEMATLGDPWMDLGTSLAYWVESTDAIELQQQAFGPTVLPGMLTREQLLERYIERTGREVINPLFYYCFGLFKLAVIVQQIYARYIRGATQDPRFAALDQTVLSLSNAGLAAIDRGTLSSH